MNYDEIPIAADQAYQANNQVKPERWRPSLPEDALLNNEEYVPMFEDITPAFLGEKLLNAAEERRFSFTFQGKLDSELHDTLINKGYCVSRVAEHVKIDWGYYESPFL